MLEEMADWVEHGAARARNADDSHEFLTDTLQGIQAAEGPQLPGGRVQLLTALIRGIDDLTSSLSSEIASELGRLRPDP
jgi:DUF1365 family protein